MKINILVQVKNERVRKSTTKIFNCTKKVTVKIKSFKDFTSKICHLHNLHNCAKIMQWENSCFNIENHKAPRTILLEGQC